VHTLKVWEVLNSHPALKVHTLKVGEVLCFRQPIQDAAIQPPQISPLTTPVKAGSAEAVGRSTKQNDYKWPLLRRPETALCRTV